MNATNNPYLLINPYDKTITPIYWDGELSSLYAILGCSCVAVASCGPYHLFVDEEGLFKPNQKFFVASDHMFHPLAGMALAVGVDEDGNTVPPDITLEELEASVMFVDAVVWEDE